MNCCNIIAYAISAIGVLLEIYGIWKTYRIKHESPTKIRESSINQDAVSKEIASIGGDIEEARIANNKDVQDELNRIIRDYNMSTTKLINDNIEAFKKSSSYFIWVIVGFSFQLVSLLIFLIQELIRQ